MANIELRHIGCTSEKRHGSVRVIKLYSKKAIEICISDSDNNEHKTLVLDISTSIRFAKTIRTCINEAKSK